MLYKLGAACVCLRFGGVAGKMHDNFVVPARQAELVNFHHSSFSMVPPGCSNCIPRPPNFQNSGCFNVAKGVLDRCGLML
jgi:hypothetical protein